MATFILDGEEHTEGDRVRLRTEKGSDGKMTLLNGVKDSALLHILKIKSDTEITVETLYTGQKLTLTVNDLQLM